MKSYKDKKVCCPYNNSHILTETSFLKHVSKCPQKDTKKHLFETCPFNTLHIIEKPMFELHKRNCPNKLVQSAEEVDLEKEMKMAGAKKKKALEEREIQRENAEKPGYIPEEAARSNKKKKKNEEKPFKEIQENFKNHHGERLGEVLFDAHFKRNEEEKTNEWAEHFNMSDSSDDSDKEDKKDEWEEHSDSLDDFDKGGKEDKKKDKKSQEPEVSYAKQSEAFSRLDLDSF